MLLGTGNACFFRYLGLTCRTRRVLKAIDSGEDGCRFVSKQVWPSFMDGERVRLPGSGGRWRQLRVWVWQSCGASCAPYLLPRGHTGTPLTVVPPLAPASFPIPCPLVFSLPVTTNSLESPGPCLAMPSLCDLAQDPLHLTSSWAYLSVQTS